MTALFIIMLTFFLKGEKFMLMLEILKNNLEQEECINGELAKEIARSYNYYGSHKKDTLELYDSLSKKGQQNFLKMVCLSALSLAHRYRFNNLEEWDLRKKASAMYAFYNQDFFIQLLEELNIRFTYRNYPDPYADMFFEDSVTFDMDLSENLVKSYLREFHNIHPTTIQSFMRGCSAVLKRELPEINFVKDDSFPMY